MFQKVINKIKDQDQFGFNPSQAIVFNNKSVFTTIPGAMSTIALGGLFIVMWY